MRGTRIAMTVALFLACAGAVQATPITFDTNSVSAADADNFWPWGDADNLRYQIWFSQSSLSGTTGVLQSIQHFLGTADLDNVGTATYTMDIYASTTSVDSGSLSSADLDSNHGANKTLIFSGVFGPTTDYLIDVNDLFDYDGSGNLLLDYDFISFSGVANSYDGPTFESMYTGQTDFRRVWNHAVEGNSQDFDGTLRTELTFDSQNAVPEPASLTLLCLGGLGIFGAARRRRNAA